MLPSFVFIFMLNREMKSENVSNSERAPGKTGGVI